MDIKGLFSKTLPLLERTMDLRARRHDAIVSNISNQDTPNYKAFDVLVEEALAKSDSESPAHKMVRTHEMHFRPVKTEGPDPVFTRRPSSPYDLRGDGNSVDIDKEMTRMTENHLMYNATAQIVSRKFASLLDVIKGGK